MNRMSRDSTLTVEMNIITVVGRKSTRKKYVGTESRREAGLMYNYRTEGGSVVILVVVAMSRNLRIQKTHSLWVVETKYLLFESELTLRHQFVWRIMELS